MYYNNLTQNPDVYIATGNQDGRNDAGNITYIWQNGVLIPAPIGLANSIAVK